jgi:ABC-2 type transport system ATP-binding protein
MTIATFTDVTHRYGAITALDQLSLDLRAGQITALLGPNGAGKTTICRLLLGLLTPNSGRVTVLGADPHLPSTRQRLGAMLQIGRAPETLRVREHIENFRAYYPHPLPTAEILHLAQLTPIQNRLFGELSGGQKQRLFFALALCGDPDLLLLDEPTVGLDIEARRALWTQIRALADRGKSILLTTHYLEEADALADRILVLREGRILADCTAAELKHRTSTRTLDDAFLALTT